MSGLARAVAGLVFGLSKAMGKAVSASGSQMVKNFKYKPEGMEASAGGSVGSGSSSKSNISTQMQMSLEEAHLILNVKKEQPMEIIQRNYESIFAANGPPPEPTPKAGEVPKPTAPPTGPRKKKGPTHSHYLQSKVYRALERIKAERDEVPVAGEAAEGPTTTPETPKSESEAKP